MDCQLRLITTNNTKQRSNQFSSFKERKCSICNKVMSSFLWNTKIINLLIIVEKTGPSQPNITQDFWTNLNILVLIQPRRKTFLTLTIHGCTLLWHTLVISTICYLANLILRTSQYVTYLQQITVDTLVFILFYD